MKPIPCRLTEPVLERIDEIAKISGLTRSEVIRTAATEFALRHGVTP
jgi:metal-responsive CopG/Arc/MetJ family transcriptional regulator